MTTESGESVEEKLIGSIVAKYSSDIDLIRNFENQLRVFIDDPVLKSLYHSYRSRVKDPAHLRDKLERKLRKANNGGAPFDITPETLYECINDLAGVRLLHLHTSEFPAINTRLHELFEENRITVLDGPKARVWDNEYRILFQEMGIATIDSERMYTSVHYIIQSNRKSGFTAEIQVRTLAEELWGEVDHSLNYPHESEILACREQIRVLARVTSSCTRLVDAIYRTRDSI